VKDSTARPGCGQRTSTAAARVARLLLLVLLASALLATACGRPDDVSGVRASPSPTTAGEAYEAAHRGALPPGLQRLDVSEREIARRIRARLSSGVGVLLPAYLPPGYGLASPFISVGSGDVLPNPQVWAGGYRVSYTDLRGLITVMVGEQRRPGRGAWQRLSRRWEGRSLAIRHDGALTVSTALGRGAAVTVSALGVDQMTVVRVLLGLRSEGQDRDD